MGKLNYTLLSSETELDGFDCGNPSVNSLVSNSYYPSILKHAFIFKISLDNLRVGFFSFSISHFSVDTSDAPIANYYASSSYGAIKLDFIAVDKQLHHKGIGTAVLKTFIGKARYFYTQLPIRVLLLDALRDKINWYLSLGFNLVDSNDIQKTSATVRMYLDLMPTDDYKKMSLYCTENSK